MSKLTDVIDEYKRLGIEQQIDYDRFYLYSIITHSTAIEGSSVTEIENRLLFDAGISANKPIAELLMNLDLKNAYEKGFEIAERHEEFTTELLCSLSGILMKNTGSIYNTALGSFSSADGDLRLVNVSAGGGKSFMSWQKVPDRLSEFIDWLNEARRSLDPGDVEKAYQLSFMAHYRLVAIHPWADGNGRMARLIMNIIQREAGVPMSIVKKESRAEYIQSLSDSQDADDITRFIDFMTEHHVQNISRQIEEYKASLGDNANSTVNEIINEYKAAPELTSKEQAVYYQIMADQNITITVIMNNTGFSRPTVTRAVKVLKDRHLISRIGAKKNGHWQLCS